MDPSSISRYILSCSCRCRINGHEFFTKIYFVSTNAKLEVQMPNAILIFDFVVVRYTFYSALHILDVGKLVQIAIVAV